MHSTKSFCTVNWYTSTQLVAVLYHEPSAMPSRSDNAVEYVGIPVINASRFSHVRESLGTRLRYQFVK